MLARKNMFRDELGNSIVEYALILSLIALVCVFGIRALGTNAKTSLDHAGTSISTAANSPSDDHSNDGGKDSGGKGDDGSKHSKS